jgi:hypothetical protein
MRATASFIIARKLPAVAGSGLPRAIPPARTIAIRRTGRSTNRRLANMLASFFPWPKLTLAGSVEHAIHSSLGPK